MMSRRLSLLRLLAVMPLAATSLAGCLQTAGGSAAASAGAAGGYRPVVDMASAPNSGAEFEKDLAKCQAFADKSTGGGSAAMPAGTTSFLSTALQNVAVGAVNGGFSSGNAAGSMLGTAGVAGANAAMQDQATAKAQAAARQNLAATPQAQYVRDCMKTYGYTVQQ
jgi:hypothetical protein